MDQVENILNKCLSAHKGGLGSSVLFHSSAHTEIFFSIKKNFNEH